MKKIILFVAVIIYSQSMLAQGLSAFEKQAFIRGKDTLRYRILYPENYKPGKAYPVIMFLHGSGERGNENEAQLIHGGDLFVKDSIRKINRAIVIFPQCPKDSTWSRFNRGTAGTERVFVKGLSATVPELMVKYLLDSLVEKKKINSKKIYLGGLSLGGMGTYDLVMKYPNYFAAAFPICGACNVAAFLEQAAPLPLWIFHGSLDNTVSPDPDRELYKLLMDKGAKRVTYTEYPGVKHNSWDNAFMEPGLIPWILSNKLPKKQASW